MNMLTYSQLSEMRRLKSYFPYRKISGILLPDGTFNVFANVTFAKARNYARKNNGVLFNFN